jgi:hypothetical protein
MVKNNKNILKWEGNESKKEIKLDVQDMDEIVVWNIGDIKNNFIPCEDDLKKFEEFIIKATELLPCSIFVPDFVSVKKIKIKPNTKHVVVSESVKIEEKTIKEIQKELNLSRRDMLPKDITTIVKWVKKLSVPEAEILLKKIFKK